MDRVFLIVGLAAAVLAALPLVADTVARAEGPTAGMPDSIQGPLHRTKGGVLIPLPEISGLACAEMRDLLERIDASDYRDTAPVPPDDPDRVLFDYENALTARYYEDCSRSEAVPRDPTSVFLRGFWSD